jgi:phosphatidylglycerol lysyltransferase
MSEARMVQNARPIRVFRPVESTGTEIPVAPSESRLERWRPWLLAMLALVVGGLLFAALRGLQHELSYAALLVAIKDIGHGQLFWALAATALSYVSLTGYDWSSLRHVGVRVPYRIVAQTSFIAYALGNAIGLGVLTGGAVRMRLYGAAGVEAGQIGRAIAFNAAAFGLGVGVVGAAALLWDAAAMAPVLRLPALLLQLLSGAVLLSAAVFVAMCGEGRDLTLPYGLRLRLPRRSVAVQQLLFSAIDIAATAAVLWVLLPAGAVSFGAFVGFFAIAITLGVISHVPGGLGVFEAVMLIALGRQMAPEALAGALVLYRAIYFVLPLAMALALLVLHELRSGIAAPVGRAAASLSPFLLAAYTLIVGVTLLVSGATPATDEASELLALHVPLALVEASHFLGSLAGLGLLFVARGMLQRLDAAWWAGLGIAAVSMVLALPKGIALSEAALLAFLALTLMASRQQFTRRAKLLAQPFSAGWWLAVAAILVASFGILLFAYRDVAYAQELWWQFAFDAHAPRSLRAMVAVAVLALMLALRQLMRPPALPLQAPTAAELERAAAVVHAQHAAEASLVLMGDKHLMLSDSGNAFIMFGRRGRSWVGLFDPVGARQEWPELVWRFLERAREAGGRPSFYQVRPQNLSLYLDAGLRVLKLGEYAYVPLAEFSLKGKNRANLRAGVNRGEREGLTFEVVAAKELPALLPRLRRISDAWLAEHQAAEKGFSLGAFSEDYVLRGPVAVVRKDAEPLAFATLMTTGLGQEATVDLMRHTPDAPRGTMDLLFAKLMLHLQAEGVQRFGLGMAPLSGMEAHPLAPSWHRLGRLLFAHGEPFYNFQGLRAFKEKFDPQWEARYLAAPGGVAPLIVLTDVAALIGGGLRGVIGK